jgi:hypothetical protein
MLTLPTCTNAANMNNMLTPPTCTNAANMNNMLFPEPLGITTTIVLSPHWIACVASLCALHINTSLRIIHCNSALPSMPRNTICRPVLAPFAYFSHGHLLRSNPCSAAYISLLPLTLLILLLLLLFPPFVFFFFSHSTPLSPPQPDTLLCLPGVRVYTIAPPYQPILSVLLDIHLCTFALYNPFFFLRPLPPFLSPCLTC